MLGHHVVWLLGLLAVDSAAAVRLWACGPRCLRGWRHEPVRDRLRRARPRPRARALGRGLRLQPVVRGCADRALRGRPGARGTRWTPSRSQAGPAPRWPRWSTRACAARPCCARRTRSWPRRWQRCTQVRGWSSSTATAKTSACPSRRSSGRSRGTGRRPRSSCTSAGTSPSTLSDRRAVPRGGDLPHRGLRARARRRLARPPARHVGRRGRVVVLRHQDDLDRRGRDARVPASGAARVRARVPQLRQARPRGAGTELPPERVHRGARARADRADAGDRRVEERRRGRSIAHPAALPLPDGMVSGLYKYIVFAPVERSTGQGLRHALPPAARRREVVPEHRLGRRATTGACRSTTGPRATRRTAPPPRSTPARTATRPRSAASCRARCSRRRRGAGPRLRPVVPHLRHDRARGRATRPVAPPPRPQKRRPAPISDRLQRRPGVDPIRRAMQRRRASVASAITAYASSRSRAMRLRRQAQEIAVPVPVDRDGVARVNHFPCQRRGLDDLLADHEERRRGPVVRRGPPVPPASPAGAGRRRRSRPPPRRS